MSISFPLLSSITSQLTEEEVNLSDKEKKVIIQTMKKFDKHKQELVYGLIKAYCIETKSQAIGLPFEGKEMKTGPRFDWDKIPPKLQSILRKFVELNVDLQN